MIILLANLLENIASLLACVPRTALENVPPPLPLERIIHVSFPPQFRSFEAWRRLPISGPAAFHKLRRRLTSDFEWGADNPPAALGYDACLVMWMSRRVREGGHDEGGIMLCARPQLTTI